MGKNHGFSCQTCYSTFLLSNFSNTQQKKKTGTTKCLLRTTSLKHEEAHLTGDCPNPAVVFPSLQ